MRLYVEPMDTVVVEVAADGKVRFEHDADWSTPTLQERRAIIYARTGSASAFADAFKLRRQGDD